MAEQIRAGAPELYILGRAGRVTRFPSNLKRPMFILDSNVVVSVGKALERGTPLSKSHRMFLRASQRQVGIQWYERSSYIPVQPTLSALELESNPSKEILREEFAKRFEKYVLLAHGIHNLSRDWIYEFYEPMERFASELADSYKWVVLKYFELLPGGDKPPDSEIRVAVEALFDWAKKESDNLAQVGGPLFYVIVYALAGSPEARRLLKTHELKKALPEEISKNVAWDFVHLHNYYSTLMLNKYVDVFFCTEDKALALLIDSAQYTGPLYSSDEILQADSIQVEGTVRPFKLKRLEGTRLENELLSNYVKLMNEVAGRRVF